MIKNYLITALRNLSRNKTYAVINITGLSIGISCAVIAYLMVSYMTGFDRNHSKRDRIYRVVTISKSGNDLDYNAGVPLPLLIALEEYFPEFEKISGLENYGGGLITVPSDSGNPVSIQEKKGIGFVDRNFYQILDRRWLRGDPLRALEEPNTAIIAQSLAQKLFPHQEALDKVINLDDKYDLKITGVVEDLSDENTDFNFNLLGSFATIIDERELDNWGNLSSEFQCFVLVKENASLQDAPARMSKLIEKYYKLGAHESKSHLLQPFTNIHYNQDYRSFQSSVSKTNVWTLVFVALFLIVTACVNFVNLATAQAVKRSKEIGVRKVLGGFKSQIRWQFLAETMMISLVSIIISLGLAELLLIKVNHYLELKLSIDYWHDLTFWHFLLVLWLFTSVLSGLYPAFVLSGFKPISVLKNSINVRNVGGIKLRKGLVVFQFIISQVLMMSTIVIMYQMYFVRHQSMGFDRKAILTIELPHKDPGSRRALVQQITQLSSVQNITSATDTPASSSVWRSNFILKTDSGQVENDAQIKMADHRYVPTYGLTVLSGKNLAESDTINGFLINETLARYAGFKNVDEAVGKQFKFGWTNQYYPIVGVVKDFHTTSFKNKIIPTVLCQSEKDYESIGVRLSSSDLGKEVEAIGRLFKSFYPEYDYNYRFLDDIIERFYSREEKMYNILVVLTLIAIFIGCLGLYGLVSFMTNQRVKEIGVRKILGASFIHILGLFSVEFLKLIAIAFIMALPLAYLGMNRWLREFIYRVNFEWWIFILTVLATLTLAMLTVGYKTVRAAITNPIDCLKDE